MVLSILAKVALGAFIGGVIGAIVTGDWVYSIVWSLALPAFILLALWAGLRKRRSGWPSGAGFALGRVETALRTGREDGGLQEVDVRLTVAPADDAPYATTARTMILTDNLRIFAPGTVHVVTRFGPERPDVVIVAEPPQEWVDLAASAQADPSIIPPASTVPAWETATTTTPGTTKPGTRTKTSLGNRIVAISIIALSAALVLIPAWPSSLFD